MIVPVKLNLLYHRGDPLPSLSMARPCRCPALTLLCNSIYDYNQISWQMENNLRTEENNTSH